MKQSFFKQILILAVVSVFCHGVEQTSAQTPPAVAETEKSPVTGTQELMRAYLQVQEQLHATQLAIERNRQEAEEIAARNALALAGRFNGIEKTMREQYAREWQSILTVAGIIAGFGFLVVLLVSYMQTRAMNRFAEVALGLPVNKLPQLAAIGSEPRLLGNPASEAAARLNSTIERLEKRIRELEGGSPANPALQFMTGAGAVETSHPDGRIGTLLAKGQSLLGQGRVGEAIASFDAALALDPKHVEALIKKGGALEKALKFDEAIACYDAAIAADNHSAIAYLYKGGVFNRQERYTEALACYEQALKAQETAQVS